MTPSLEVASALRRAYREIFAIAAMIPQEPRIAPGQPGQYRARVDALLAEERSRLSKAGVEDALINVAELAVVALMDEVARSRSDMRDEWQPIQNEQRFRTDLGHVFFERLKGLRSDASTPVELLEIFSRCLEWGLQGELADKPAQLATLRAALLDELKLKRGPLPNLIESPAPAAAQRRNTTIPAAWWPAAMVAVVLFVVWGGVRCRAEHEREEVRQEVRQTTEQLVPGSTSRKKDAP